MTRRLSALFFLSVLLLASCGEKTDTKTAQSNDIDEVITAFGRGLIIGDLDVVLDHLAPADRAEPDEKEIKSMRSAWDYPGAGQIAGLRLQGSRADGFRSYRDVLRPALRARGAHHGRTEGHGLRQRDDHC